jgi:hypothetical protein
MCQKPSLLGWLDSPLLHQAFYWAVLPCNDNATGKHPPPADEEDIDPFDEDFPAGLLTLY